MQQHPFARFLEGFIPQVDKKSTQLGRAGWILETTGSQDAAALKADLDTELKLLYHSPEIYKQLLAWDQDAALRDPLLKRQLNVLIRAFKQNQIPEELLEEISQKEAELAQTYANFRPKVDGKALSENDLRGILKKEKDPAVRKRAWEASKEIGAVLAPRILELVQLRNRAAKSLGYPDFFRMQLELQEVDQDALQRLLDDVGERSHNAYAAALGRIEESLAARFGVLRPDLGPWAWSEPFCQEDPLDAHELDSLAEGVDLVATCKGYYRKMGFDVGPILEASDLYERPGKNQHAFCTHIDRKGDIRTLNNVKPTIKWLETLLHELGHAVYDLGYDPQLPWLLREPPHMITTEAMALLAGRQAYRKKALAYLVQGKEESLFQKAEESLTRRQLIFSRWVLVMSAFERELYRNSDQDLNALWWRLVEKHQMVRMPPNRQGKSDWAAKYHIGIAPVYYYSYLLGELFASQIQRAIENATGSKGLEFPEAGVFLTRRLFAPGDSMNWSDLVRHVAGEPLSSDAWLSEFTLNGEGRTAENPDTKRHSIGIAGQS